MEGNSNLCIFTDSLYVIFYAYTHHTEAQLPAFSPSYHTAPPPPPGPSLHGSGAECVQRAPCGSVLARAVFSSCVYAIIHATSTRALRFFDLVWTPV